MRGIPNNLAIYVDGYNLIGRGRRCGLSLESDDKEKRLLDLLARYRDRRGAREEMTVIFDGSYSYLAHGPSRFNHRGIKVEYTLGKSADDAIIARVEAAGPRGRILVVTSDREIRRRVKDLGAETVTSGEFLSQVEESLPPSEETAEKPEGVAPGEVDEWLRLFSEGRDEDEGS